MPQAKWVSSQPATRGPSGSPSMTPTAVTAMARGRSFSENMVGRIAVVSGRMIAAPMPMTARIAIRPFVEVIWPATTDETPNSSSPKSSSRRRP